MENEIQNALLASDGIHVNRPVRLPFETYIPAAAPRVSDSSVVHLGAKDNSVCHKAARSVLSTIQPKSMVKYRHGRDLGLLRSVRLASNSAEKIGDF